MVMMTFVLIATLLLGFVLGRIWEIRHQIVLAEHRGTRQRPAGGSVMTQVPEQAQSDDRRLTAALEQIRDVVTTITSAQEQSPQITIRRLGSTPYPRHP
jgi:hypothetical protein